MIPAKAKVNIYRSSTNGFVFEFVQPDGSNFDLSLFEKVEAVLFRRKDRFNPIESFDMQVIDNVASVSFTPEKTEELFLANSYSFEIRMYDSETSFLVYVAVDLEFLDVFEPDGKVHGATVIVDENETATVTITESSVFAALAQNAAQQSQELFDELELIRDELQPIIDNQTELISLSQVEGLDILADKIADVEIVADNVANVVSVGENIGAVTDVQNIITELLAVHEKLTEVQTVADNVTNVNTVATNITAVNTAANNIQAIIDASDFASDAQKHAQETIAFQDSNNVTFDKGAKGWSEDAEASSQQAQTSATNASNSADSASTSETNASDSATASEQSRQASESAKDASQTARNESQSARDKSQEWAEQDEDVEVETGQFSSLHYARKSEEFATDASNSADSASTSETNAGNSASSASSSEQKASEWSDNDRNVPVEESPDRFSSKHWAEESESYAINAEQSEQNASTSEQNALTSEQNASTSETNASDSATSALNSKNDAETSAQNAQQSESNALDSETSASQSETSASTSASNALDSETNASASEQKASEWADNDRNVPVESNPDKFSAKHWAEESQESAETFETVEEQISGATEKTTPPVDEDQLGLVDSEDGGVLKKLSWQSVKQTLSNIFVNISDVVDNLTSTDTDKPLSANQGRILNNNNEDTQSELTDFKNEKGSDSGLAPLDNQGYVPIYHTNPSVRSSKVVNTIADRDAIDTDQRYEGFRVHVIDATADETVNEGNAGYILKAGLTNNDWVKNYENEALDVDSSDDIPEGEQNLYRSPADKDKLDGIESGAEVNQTDEEIKIQYENNDDTNAYTDAEKTKLGGIESGAEVNVDTNLSEGGTGNERTIESSTGENVQISTASSENAGYMSTDDKDKLDGVESGAEVNQTDTEIKTQYESNDDTNAFTDVEKSKLGGIESGAEVNIDTNLSEGGTGNSRTIISSTGGNVTISTATSTNAGYMSTSDKSKLDDIESGAEVNVDTDLGITGTGNSRTITSSTGDNVSIPTGTTSNAGFISIEDKTKLNGIESGAEVNQSDSEIKTQYENNTNTNAFTDVEKSKLGGIESGAEVNVGDSFNNSGDYSGLRARSTTIGDVGGVPSGRTITINGNSQSLSSNRTWSVGTITGVSAGTGLTGGGSSGDVTLNISNPFNPSGSYSGLRAQSTTKSDVGLSNVDNTSDMDKPVSSAQQSALDDKASLSALGSMSAQDSDDVDITGGKAVLQTVKSEEYTVSVPANTPTEVLDLGGAEVEDRRFGMLFVRDNGGARRSGQLTFSKVTDSGSANVVTSGSGTLGYTFSTSGTSIRIEQASSRTVRVTIIYFVKGTV